MHLQTQGEEVIKTMDISDSFIVSSDDSDSGLQIDETSRSFDEKISDTPISAETIPLIETNGPINRPKRKCTILKKIPENEVSSIRKRRKQTRKNKPKVIHESINGRLQFPLDEVSRIITLFTKFMTDIKYRTCIYCPYVDAASKFNLMAHVKRSHKDKLDSWCSRCNQHYRNILKHKRKKQCIISSMQCPFCKRKPTYFLQNLNFQNHITHLKTHCRVSFPELPGLPVKIAPAIFLAPPLPVTDDDYMESENISFDRVPRLHVSVTAPKLKQFPWEEVTDAVRQAEGLFYGNRLCFVCLKLTNGAMDLGLHMLKNHSTITNGKWCHVCNQLVPTLFEHLQSHKSDVLKCSLCKDSCESFSDLRSHLIDHAVYSSNRASRIMPKWFLCPNCPKAFAEELEFNRHVTQH